jgi:CheY-like chemotaxis protein
MTADNAPLRTIVVEDEPLVRLMTEDVLVSIGCVIVASASTLNEAMRCIPAMQLDLAVLDVNLGGTEVYPAAELLRSQGTPIIFVTGYGRRGVPETWHRFPILQKPFTSRELEKAIAHVSGA